jgi:outer membrane protein insertion porin family/translocation and assembly module TamA
MPDVGHVVRRASVALLLFTPVLRAGAQDIRCDPGDQEVVSLEFTGNRTFRDDELSRRIVTTASSFAQRTFGFFGTRFCLDSLEVRRDSLRLILLYRTVGFSEVRVGSEISQTGRDRVGVTFRITEGRPVLVDSVAVSGLEALPDGERLARPYLLRRGERFDRVRMDQGRDSLTRLLRNNGYPRAEVLRSFETDTAAHTAVIEYGIVAGPRARIGDVEVTVEAASGKAPRVDPEQVRRVLGVDRGNIYRERALEDAKRGLYLTNAFRHVDISIDSASLAESRDTLVDVDVRLLEADLQAARTAFGWGTLDCFRSQVEWSNFNFLGRLLRLDFSGRLSKIGRGNPLDIDDGVLCAPEVQRDAFSEVLNYYAGVTLSQAALYRLKYVPSILLYSERRSEPNVYLRRTPIGAAVTVNREGNPRLPMSFTYQMEYGSTQAQPVYFCGLFRVCTIEDQQRLTSENRQAVVGWTVTRNRANDLVNPTVGSVMSLQVRYASPIVGSDPDVQFTRVLADASVYRPIRGGAFVARIRGGTVVGQRLSLRSGRTSFIPLQERMYAGGPTTVRGFRQNELGASLYLPRQLPGRLIVDSVGPSAEIWQATTDNGEDVVPLGGDNMVVANAELRQPLPFYPNLGQYALFVDAGEVWTRRRNGTGGFDKLKVTPGVGVRIYTLVGPVRVDVGYNPYVRLPGQAFFTPTGNFALDADHPLQLICVSPGNELVVTPSSPANQGLDFPPQQEEGACPVTYIPKRRTNFLQRLTFQFSIGQAF